MNDKPVTDFEKAAEQTRVGFFSDFWIFLKHNNKWWLIPVLLVLLLLGGLMVLSGTAVAPFIYSFF